MANYVYFDVLDTARTRLGGGEVEVEQAEENRFRGQAEIKLSLLCGWIPAFPQTYGWDSSALLDYGSEQSFAGKSFFSLVQQGLIRICLRNHDSIWDAALEAFASPTFRHLSAWPEFNTHNPVEARRPLVETMRQWKSPTPNYSEALSDDVRKRLELLRELSSVVKPGPPEERELRRESRLSNLIKAAAGAAPELDAEVANLLSRCTTEVPDPNNRTAIDAFLDQEAEKENMGHLVPMVREITNGCFNAVAAHCVRARAALTLPRSMPVAHDVLLRCLPGSKRSDAYQRAIAENEVSELKSVSWRDIDIFLQEYRGLPPNEILRRAEAAKLIAKKVVDQDPKYVMKFEKKNSLYNTAIWGSTALAGTGAAVGGAVGGMVGHAVAGAEGAIKGAAVGAGAGSLVVSAVVNGLAGNLTSRDIRKEQKDKIGAELEQKYRGLIETVENHMRDPAPTQE